MRRMWIVFVALIFTSSTVWAQLVVKNATGDVVLRVDNQANVTVGSTTQNGDLTTHTITVLQGAANGLVLKSDASGQASWSTDLVNDDDHVIGNEIQNLKDVLGEGNSANNQDAHEFRRIGVGVSNPDSRIRVEEHAASTLPVVGIYNTSIFARDWSSTDAEKQVVIEGVGTAMSTDQNSVHLGVQGFLVGGSENDQWIASASLGYHNTNSGNQLSGVSSNVKDVGTLLGFGHKIELDCHKAIASAVKNMCFSFFSPSCGVFKSRSNKNLAFVRSDNPLDILNRKLA